MNEAEASLRTAAGQELPHRTIANEVAVALTPNTALAVVVAEEPRKQDEFADELEPRTIPAGFHSDGNELVTQRADTELRIHLVQARLSGKGGFNSRLALRLEAQATLINKRSGAVVYSCPVSYRSAERRFKTWAAHDAQLFRQELAGGCREMGVALADQLVAKGLVAPGRRPYSTVAKN
jgi:hypothetical protein